MKSPRTTAAPWALPLLRVVLLCNLALLVWYVCFGYRHLLHSDAAAMNLLAQEILETGKYFPSEWNYVNKDLWVLFLQTMALPFAAFLPNGMAVHAGGCLLASAVVLHATWMLSGALGQSRLARTVTLVIATAGWSATMTETLYGQAAYGLLYAMGAYLFAFTVAAGNSGGTRRWRYAAAAGFVLLLAFWGNPQRAVVQYAVPLLAAALLPSLRARRRPGRDAWKTGLALLAFAAAGIALHQFTLATTTATTGLTQVRYLDLPGMIDNAGRTLRGLLMLFDAVPRVGSVPTTAYGIGVAARLVGALALTFVILPWAIRRAWNTREPVLAALLAFSLSALAITLFLMLTSSLSDPNIPDGSIRYLVLPLLCLVVMTTGLVVDRPGPARPILVLAAGTLVLLACSAPVAYSVPDAKLFAVGVPARTDALLAFLRQHRLEYGYATFWNASRFTVLSSGAVRIRQVDLVKGLPMPKRHLSSDRWYRPEAWQGRSFLLLDESELPAFQPDALARLVGAPEAELRFENWRIFVYPHNLARDMPGWDISYRRPLAITPGAGTARLIGQAVDATLVARQGEAGMLAFGPWLTVQRGSYVATFDLDTAGAGNDFGGVDVVSGQGTVTHGAASIGRAGRQQIAVPFTLDRVLGDVELRVRSTGQGRLTLHRITLQKARP
ncbi:hypothetical protein [Pseudoduganella umbonata]|uniref:Glycosyltransferase RgtA/B/C/D-like domain-containing protein n=1 Tax=Pseudoduganella umbonata TaxID=864828 RepID=A0A4P8HTH1_9BURK|nr:hypothetical protein [Pseudoduganella umbonata]MBB3220854.1 hypothetical protein [Pseudoduganella umbonata]QCP11685.1 hypothetical protein FCL38_15595 [Pseudoduganella umbonata]